MPISKGCLIKAQAGLTIHAGLNLADWFLNKKDEAIATEFIAATLTRLNDARKAFLISEETAGPIKGFILTGKILIDEHNLQGASEEIMNAAVLAIDEAMEQVVQCECPKRREPT